MRAFKVVRNIDGEKFSAIQINPSVRYRVNKWAHPFGPGPLSVFATKQQAAHFVNTMIGLKLQIWPCEARGIVRHEHIPDGTIRVREVKLIPKGETES